MRGVLPGIVTALRINNPDSTVEISTANAKIGFVSGR